MSILIKPDVISNESVESLQRKANEWALQQLCKIDPLLDADLKKAEEYKKLAGYNPEAGPGDKKNILIMATYDKMFEIACIESDKRITQKMNATQSALQSMKDQQK